MKKSENLLIAILVILSIALSLVVIALFTSDACADGDCLFVWKDEKIMDDMSLYEAENDICMVTIKASTETYTFLQDECQDGYCVSGIGTVSGIAYNENGRHDISNVGWYEKESTTAVSITSVKSLNVFERISRWISGLVD